MHCQSENVLDFLISKFYIDLYYKENKKPVGSIELRKFGIEYWNWILLVPGIGNNIYRDLRSPVLDCLIIFYWIWRKKV